MHQQIHATHLNTIAGLVSTIPAQKPSDLRSRISAAAAKSVQMLLTTQTDHGPEIGIRSAPTSNTPSNPRSNGFNMLLRSVSVRTLNASHTAKGSTHIARGQYRLTGVTQRALAE